MAKRLLVAVLVLLALVAVGCGGDDDDTNTDTPTSETNVDDGATAVEDTAQEDDEPDEEAMEERPEDEVTPVPDPEEPEFDVSDVWLTEEPVKFEVELPIDGTPPLTVVSRQPCGAGGPTTLIDTSTVITDAATRDRVEEQFSDFILAEKDVGDGALAFRLDNALIDPDQVISETAALRSAGTVAMLNVVYSFSPQLRFYPVDAAEESANAPIKNPAKTPPNGVQRANVLTIDTGVPPKSNDGSYSTVPNIDPQFTEDNISDDFTGHGPAIADLISRTMGLSYGEGQRHSFLVQIDATQTIEMPLSPNIRAFTTTALQDTLAAIDKSGIMNDPSTPIDVVNLSFGAKGCESLFEVDGVIMDPMWQWMNKHDTVTFVASAGNNGTSSTTYPAAWTTTTSSVGERIISVGATNSNGDPSCYSDYGDWVDTWAVGDKVEVNLPQFSGLQVWSGTSFAAPQVAATEALGLTHQTMTPNPPKTPQTPTPKSC